MMKTDKNSRTTTAEGLSVHPERAFPATNHGKEVFEVEFHFTQHSTAYMRITAKSLAEAEHKASQIELDEIENWNANDGDFYVFSVEPLTGDEAND